MTNSPNISELELEQLTQLFPQFFSDGKFDYEAFKAYMNNEIIDESERYKMSWHGKEEAKRRSKQPSILTLRPEVDKSKNRDTTKNLFIEGDNLEVLKLLLNHYYNKVKMIYIDPPYNKDKDFVYSDTWKDTLEGYLKQTGQRDEEGATSTETESSGRKHSNWLNMIYPRLRVARKLLKDDGVIFVSIDDDEVANLRKVMDEIFGEQNFLVQIVRNNGGTSSSHFNIQHEYVLVYGKSKKDLSLFQYNGNEDIISDRTIKKPSKKNPVSVIKFPKGIEFRSDDKVFPSLFGDKEPVKIVSGKLEALNGKLAHDVEIEAARTMKNMIENWIDGDLVYDQKGQKVTNFYFKDNGVLQYEKERGTIHPNSIISDITTKQGTKSITSLFNNTLFDFSKPPQVIKELLRNVSLDGIVIDFFAGTGTTAHAVMELNKEDEGNRKRKRICVQLPEQIAETEEAYKAGYRTISELCRARIDKVIEKYEEDGVEGDLGYRAWKLDKSNFHALNPVEVKEGETSEEELNALIQQELEKSGVISERSALDIVAELMLREGVSLTASIQQDENNVYHITDEKQSFFVFLEKPTSEWLHIRIKAHKNDDQCTIYCLEENLTETQRMDLTEYVTLKTV